jgi:hypothetical protein
MEEWKYVEGAFSEAHKLLPDGWLRYAVSIAEGTRQIGKLGDWETGKLGDGETG